MRGVALVRGWQVLALMLALLLIDVEGGNGGEQNDSARRRMCTCTLDVMPVSNNFDSANARIKPSTLTQSAPSSRLGDRRVITAGVLREHWGRSTAYGGNIKDENKTRPSRRGIAQAARAVVDRGHREIEEGRAHSAAGVTKTEFQRRPRESQAHLEPGKSWYEVCVRHFPPDAPRKTRGQLGMG
ncbi:hypothetical protein C8R44DRAFT_739804 [Mycena epipterygia]|nr:hypothetical protein C8R44DRAFT_739804 [Mycena epipterygia]